MRSTLDPQAPSGGPEAAGAAATLPRNVAGPGRPGMDPERAARAAADFVRDNTDVRSPKETNARVAGE